MSDATERPQGQHADADADAWAAACEEDLAAERARRRERYGPPPVDAADELRKLVDTVTGELGRLGLRLGIQAAPLAAQARSALDPVLDRNSDVLRHLANAGQELVAAYRAAVTGHEQRWARPSGPADPGGAGPQGSSSSRGDDEPGDDPGPQKIHLD